MNTTAQENKTDPSRRSSPDAVNREIDQQTRENLQSFRHGLSKEQI